MMPAGKPAERRAFERKLARVAKATRKIASEAFGIVAEARALGLADERVGAVMIALEAVQKAAARAASAVRDMEDRAPVQDEEPDNMCAEKPLSLARWEPGVGYVLNGRVVG